MGETRHMDRALELARRAEGAVSPRPPVGAVIVSADGEIVGEGFTRPTPGPHAEVVALQQAQDRARGASVYVTLEPCPHHGSTPPCTDALIAAGVSRVVIGCLDPYPDVDGRGVAALRDARIAVEVGVRREEAERIIEPFAHWVRTGRPFVTLKLAATLDGKVAAPDGTSRWITGEAARHEVHELRRAVDAVVVGAGTVAADDPALTCRLSDPDVAQPRRVVLDSSGRTDPAAAIFDGAAPVSVVTTADVPPERRAAWQRAGADVHVVDTAEGGVHLEQALRALAGAGVCHALVEGGPTLAASVVTHGLFDRCLFYLAPALIGGDAPGMLSDGVKTLADAWRLRISDVRTSGEDIRIEARPEGD